MMMLMTIAERMTARTPNVIQSVLLDPSETEKEEIIISYYYLSYYVQNNNWIFYNYFHD